MHFTVTVATPEDDVAVGALLDASYPVLMQPAYDPVLLARALPLMTQANPALLASGTFYLAKTEHNLVIGCGGWTRERPGDGRVEDGLGHLRHFATHPAWIGRAVGRSIYEICEREARFAGRTRLACYASLNAEGFYAALGLQQSSGLMSRWAHIALYLAF